MYAILKLGLKCFMDPALALLCFLYFSSCYVLPERKWRRLGEILFLYVDQIDVVGPLNGAEAFGKL